MINLFADEVLPSLCFPLFSNNYVNTLVFKNSAFHKKQLFVLLDFQKKPVALLCNAILIHETLLQNSSTILRILNDTFKIQNRFPPHKSPTFFREPSFTTHFNSIVALRFSTKWSGIVSPNCLRFFSSHILAVYPDKHIFEIVKATFGDWAFATKKIRRMFYWNPKLRYSNKYLDRKLQENRHADLSFIERARMALEMMSRDKGNQISYARVNSMTNFPILTRWLFRSLATIPS